MDLTRRAFALGSLGLLGAACGRSTPSTRLQSGSARRTTVGSLTAAELASAQRAFGLDLLGRVCRAGSNTTLSPASAALALGLLTAAARGDTERRISDVLHLPRWSDDVVAAYAAQHAALARRRAQLQISNRCYTQVGAPTDRRTLDDWATGFAAVLGLLDFADSRGATARINADVSRDTAGLVPRLLDSPLDGDTVAVLVNALHLKADWRVPFRKGETRDTAFTTDSGRTVQVPMMAGASGDLREAGGWCSLTLPYVGDALEMLVVLPPQGTGCAGLTTDALDRLSRSAVAPGVDVVMPKLDLSQTHQLLPVLRALGLPAEGDYGPVGGDHLDEVVQKVVLRVDEKGTEAAAATAIGVGVVSNPRTVVFDRPYYLLLQDTTLRTPLVLSRVVDPSL